MNLMDAMDATLHGPERARSPRGGRGVVAVCPLLWLACAAPSTTTTGGSETAGASTGGGTTLGLGTTLGAHTSSATGGDATSGSAATQTSAASSDASSTGADTNATASESDGTTGAPPRSRPLTVHARNPRYFDDGAGAAVVLVGTSHGWELQDDAWTAAYALDYAGFLDYLESYQLNFIRMWRVESPKQTADDELLASPLPYLRTGPGDANDGAPRFDLEQLDPAFFERLHARCAAAAARGVYVDIMLFERHSTFNHNGPLWPWRGHPFHKDNNVNGIDADVDGDGQGREYFVLPEEGGSAEVLALQEDYVRAAIDAVADLDNVLFEICNECKPEASAWQEHMIAVARAHMDAIERVFPVGFTGPGTHDDNTFPDFQVQLDSDADFVSPRDNTVYKNNPPANDGAKIIFADSDHIDPYGRDEVWVWKSFTRGLHPQALEVYDIIPPDPPNIDPARDERVRRSLGACREVAERVELAALEPANALCSSAFCLADTTAGAPVIVLLPGGDPVELDLSAAAGVQGVEWLELATGAWSVGEPVTGGGLVVLTPPFAGHAVALVGAEM